MKQRQSTSDGTMVTECARRFPDSLLDTITREK